MRISVISCSGVPPVQPLAYDFGEGGGSIGRDESNQLQLPDPDRHISRVQARIEWDGQGFVIVDMGANPSLINGRPLGRGNRVALAGGEEIVIAGYVLRVEFASKAPVFSSWGAESTPINDPLGMFGAAAESLGSAGASAGGGLFDRPRSDARSVGVRPDAALDDPFAVFVPAAASSPAVESPPERRDEAPGRSLPHDSDPLGLGGLDQGDSVDAVFGLAASPADPLAGTPLGETFAATPGSPGLATDPLALLGGSARGDSPMPQRDDSPMLNQAIALPHARPEVASSGERPRPDRSPPPSPVAERPPVNHAEMFLSWDDAGAASGDVCKAAPDDPTRVYLPPDRKRPAEHPPKVVARPAPAPVPAPGVSGAGGDTGALRAAFEKGLGVGLALPEGISPAFMEEIGVVLREAIQGTIDLLKARAETKREVRAQATMIVSRGNNPLKFCPDVSFALSQLLVARGRGFMKAEEAMRDAFNDLRAHQFGLMAGMNAALAGVLKRFEPAVLERRVVGNSLLDHLVPSSRKARLWKLFEEMYEEISREAADDFQTLFGREFLRAYEEQVRRLEASEGSTPAVER